MKMPDLDQLDLRIVATEQRLLDRQARLRLGWTALGDQVREATRPERLAVPAAGLAAFGLALAWMRRRRRPAGPPRAAAPAPARPDLPWMRLIGLGWALLPRHWRAMAPRPLVEAAAVFGPVLAGLLVRRRAVQREP